MKLRRIFAISFLGLILGCDKPTNFNYLVPETKTVRKEVSIKQLIGTNQLDILWVIDNSGSMRDHQQNVIRNMNKFITALTSSSSLDWKSGLISTSEGELPFGGFAPGDEWLYSDPNVGRKMETAVGRLGTSGDATERTFTPVLDALQRYPNFLRSGGAFAIIVISDAPEQSDINADDFVQALSNYKGGLAGTYFYGFLNPRDWCYPTDDTWAWLGSPFQQVNTQIKGKFYKLCDPDFATNLADLGKNLGEQVSKSRIYLKEVPRIETIRVFYKGQELPGGPQNMGGQWIYRVDLNAIEFHDLSFAPGPNESVQLRYDVDDGTVLPKVDKRKPNL